MKRSMQIAEDVVQAAEALARIEKKSADEIVSELARKALAAKPPEKRAEEEFLGFRPFASRGGVVTNAQINELRKEDAA